MPPGHPIILLKSDKFNMAAVSVKRSIITKLYCINNHLTKGVNHTRFSRVRLHRNNTLENV